MAKLYKSKCYCTNLRRSANAISDFYDNALKNAGLTMDDIQLIELNEAFAAQSLGCIKQLHWEDKMDIINVNGGAIALGHPVGSSGCRILVTLMYEMKKRGLKYGLATLCIAGGMGQATVIEMCD